MLKKAFYILIVLGCIGLTHGQVRIPTDTLNILFVGNSYTFSGNMTHLVSQISDSTRVKLITRTSASGGVSLSDHWNSLKGLNTVDIIKNNVFDIIVFQEHSMGTIKKHPPF